MSRIVTGKLNLRFDPVNVCEVIDHAVDVTRAAAQTKGISLTTNLPKAVCFVNGDGDRLQQIVWNLLSNAVKFTPAGGRVDVSLVAEDNVFELTVSDTGTGISAEFLPSVFDRFRQADGSMTREHGGLGLGLAIVKELTELHGGTVRAASGGPGQGASFTVRLPQLAGLHFHEPILGNETGRRGSLAGVEILAVDDNQDAIDVLAMALSVQGARVRTASSGQDAIREFERAPVDVLLCDLAMPVVSGFDVLRSIRQKDALRKTHTIAIALTAHASEDHRAESLNAGFDGHIAKPYDASQLTRTIADALGRAST